MRRFLAAFSFALLAACGFNGTDRYEEENTAADRATASHDNLADTMASSDPAPGETMTQDIPDPEDRPIMQLQVVLDRQGFGPGVIDGKMGMSTENALRGFQEANDLTVTGRHDRATKQALSQWDNIPATRVVTIPEQWAELTFVEIPEDTAEKADMDKLGYTSLDEKLAERFHTTIETLRMLNPGGKPAGMEQAGSETPAGQSTASATVAPATPTPTASAATGNPAPEGETEMQSLFAAGQQIRVPNIGADRIDPDGVSDKGWQQTLQALGVGTQQPEVDRIVVSKAGKTLKAYRDDRLVALFTVSSGSSRFPLPLGEWKIVGEAYNPPYRYDPEVLGQDDGETEVYELPAGPNSPVGVVWIDLSKEHYGIHGTPDPGTIGRAQSSGCVRLTNWDAARLAGMVSQSTKVIFEA